MLQVHHLNNSRSQRVLWLLEELGLDYEIVRYQRDAKTNLAPPEMKKVHPLGKAPVLVDGHRTIAESGALLDYVVRRHGKGRLAPKPGSEEHETYLEWLHYAEGSAMLPVMLKLLVGRLGEGGQALTPRIHGEIENHFGYMESRLVDDYFVGSELTAADVNLSFPIQAGRMLYGLDKFPRLAAFLERIQARPAYVRAKEKGGEYAFG